MIRDHWEDDRVQWALFGTLLKSMQALEGEVSHSESQFLTTCNVN